VDLARQRVGDRSRLDLWKEIEVTQVAGPVSSNSVHRLIEEGLANHGVSKARAMGRNTPASGRQVVNSVRTHLPLSVLFSLVKTLDRGPEVNRTEQFVRQPRFDDLKEFASHRLVLLVLL